MTAAVESMARPGAVSDRGWLSGAVNMSFVWVLFTATTPFILHMAIPGHPYKLLVAGGLGLGVMALLLGGRVVFDDAMLLTILGVQACYAACLAIIHELFFLGIELKYVNLSVQFGAVLVLYLYILRFYSMRKIIISAIYVMAGIGVLGAVAFVLAALGILPVISEFQGPTWVTYNFGLTFSPVVISFGGATFMRVSGFFDEPGTLAFYITFALLTNKLLGHSKRLEWVLIITGMFTFSIAFFLSVVLYWVFCYFRPRHIRWAIVGVGAVVGLLMYVTATREESPVSAQVYDSTIGRFQRAESGSGQLFSGDTRSVLMRAATEAFKTAPWFGHSFSVSSNPRSPYYGIHMDANVMWPFAAHGLIGVMIFFGAYLYWTVMVFGTRWPLDRIIVGSWVVVSANLIQRPNAFGGAYGYFVFIFFIYATKWRVERASAECASR